MTQPPSADTAAGMATGLTTTTAEPPQAPHPPARGRRWPRRLAWGLAGLLALALLLWQVGPSWARQQAEKQLSQALGRSVAVGDLAFKPWTLELTVRDLVIGPAPGSAAGTPALLRLASLHVDADLRSLWDRAPVLESLVLESPVVHLARTSAGHYDIDDLLARLASRPDAAPEGEPPRFALYNLAVRNGALHLDDQPVQRRHAVTALQLTLPFISNLPAQVAVKVQPRLAFQFNGSAFDTGAQATPFASTRTGELKLKMAPLDLLPYLAYLPASLPVRLLRGQVQADLALDFTQAPDATPQIVLRGDVAANNLALADARADARTEGRQPLLAWQRLALQLRDVRPLQQQVGLGRLKIDGPELHVARDGQGRINWLGLVPASAGPAPAVAPVPTAPTSATTSAPPRKPAAAAWAVTLEALDISAMRVHWTDAAVAPQAALLLDGLQIGTGALAWPLAGAVPVRAVARLARPEHTAGTAIAGPGLGQLTLDGQVDAAASSAVLDFKLDGFDLQAVAPYLAPHLSPALAGRLGLSGHAELAAPGGVPQLTLRDGRLGLDDLRLSEDLPRSARKLAPAGQARAQPVVSLKQLALEGIQVDLAARRVSVAQLSLVQPMAKLQRDGQGVWNLQRWPRAVAADRPAPPKKPAGAAAPPAAPWRIDLQQARLDGGQVRVSDAFASGTAADHAVVFDLNALKLALKGLALRAGPAGVVSTAPTTLSLSARLNAPASERGAAAAATIAWRGQVGLQPVLARGQLSLARFPVHLFEPYFGHRLKLDLERAEVGAQTELQVQDSPGGLRAQATGELLLADVRVNAREAGGERGDPLVTWQSLKLQGVKLALEPGRPPSVLVGEAALNDFYSRLVLTEQGRFNLQDVGAADGQADQAAAPATPASVAAPAPAASAAAPASAVSPASPGPDIQIGATVLSNGRIDFTDRFVRPNYSAALTELNGRLGAFRSGTREMATLELRGRAAGTALLDISGQINPTADPLALDIRARATDLELAPLSTYAAKYAGYAIERGKLTMDVAYKIAPDGQLEAKNQVILNQLTFGDKVDSPTATKLPVLFAVALLKDRNGVIDINLPISGSLSDPQFSVGGIIWKLLLNLIGRALNAPFSLLAGGGSDDLSVVEFAPGTARMADSGTAALDKVAQALSDRPALKMTVTGAADAASEREALQRAALEARLLVERRRELSRTGATAEVVGATVSLGAEDRARVLKEVYRQTSWPDKPRNLVGMAKDLPTAEMERLLLARMPATEEAVRELALQRGLAVRDALMARGLPSERLFLAAPKLRTPGSADAAWKPQVGLTLSAN